MKRFLFKAAVRTFILLFAALLLAKSSMATTAVMLSDEQLVTSSRVILLGEVKSIRSQWDLSGRNINTYVKLHVSQVLKGQIQNEQVVFKQLGGIVDDASTVI